MATKKQIEDFLSLPLLAMAGVSRKPSKFGAAAYRELTSKGMIILPINPKVNEIDGQFCFNRVSGLPLDVGGIIVMTRKENSLDVVKEGFERGIMNYWIQRTSESDELIKFVEQNGINAIIGECILMHYNAGGIHKFHRTLRSVFGTMPQ